MLTEKTQNYNENRELSTIEKNLSNLIRIIDNLTLKESARDNMEQKALLEKKKEQAKKLIEEVLEKVNFYVMTIHNLEYYLSTKNPISEKIEISDKARTLAHNSLMSAIDSTTRFIKFNFGILPEETESTWEDEKLEKNQELLDVQRVQMPNILFVDTKNRKEVTNWAVKLASSGISKIKPLTL